MKGGDPKNVIIQVANVFCSVKKKKGESMNQFYSLPPPPHQKKKKKKSAMALRIFLFFSSNGHDRFLTKQDPVSSTL